MYKTFGELQQLSRRNYVPVYKQTDFQNVKPDKHVDQIQSTNYKVPVYEKKESGKSLWGPPLWFSLHFGALNLPDKLSTDDQSMIVNFLKSLPIWIPCDECKNHAFKYIQENTYRLMSMSKTKEGVFQFLWEFHNHVNKETGKEQISLEEAYHIYMHRPQTVFK